MKTTITALWLGVTVTAGVVGNTFAQSVSEPQAQLLSDGACEAVLEMSSFHRRAEFGCGFAENKRLESFATYAPGNWAQKKPNFFVRTQ